MKDMMKKISALATKKVLLWVIGILGGTGIVVGIFALILLIMIIGAVASNDSANGSGGGFCTVAGDPNMSAWDATYTKMGALKNEGKTVMAMSKKYNLDPIMFSAIMIQETGWGTSYAVRVNKNPGGLMDPKSGWSVVQTFPTLADGIEAMAYTLNTLVNERGLNTIESLGKVYAPVGAANDPGGLNKNWIPSVTAFADELGGLTTNCDEEGVLVNVPDGKFVIPTKGIFTSAYGMRYLAYYGEWRLHAGVDFGAARGTPIWSSANGVVSAVQKGCYEGDRKCGTGWGNYVRVKHKINGKNYETLYAHLTEVKVNVGQQVKGGHVIGTMGHTGNSTGPHLHFEIHEGSFYNPIDPQPFLPPLK